jgi:ADP-ribose pyrophosphatase YjhB (NUDIX family)
MSSRTPRFCAHCAGPLACDFIESEQRSRLRCSDCGGIAYRNPQVLVSTIVCVGEGILLCKRKNAPAAGTWALPGGFMECDETLEEAAARETFEETGVHLSPRALQLHAVSTLPEISEVYVGFVASMEMEAPPELVCGPECSAVHFFDEVSVPWGELSYPDIGAYLRVCFRELQQRQRVVHFSRLDASGVVSHAYQVAAVVETHRSR